MALGNDYSIRFKEDRAENLEKAIEHYKDALKVYTKKYDKEEWARLQDMLGSIYYKRMAGNKVENLNTSVNYYLEALKVRTRDNFPINYARTQEGIGYAYFALAKNDETKLYDAYDAFSRTIETIEYLRSEIVSGSNQREDKQKHAEKWHRLYRSMVDVCLKLNQPAEALEYVERSKARNLIELILNRDLKTMFPPEVAGQLEKIRDEIADYQDRLQKAQGQDSTDLIQHLQKLRAKRQ